MLTHSQIWKALDALAESNSLSPSGLAKKAGLDPTTFNKSKRASPDGRQRWPSTESIAKALEATSTSLPAFVAFITDGPATSLHRSVPLIAFGQAVDGNFFDEAGFPSGDKWDEISFPALGDENSYALEVSGNELMPLYRDGDRILVSPTTEPRRGDRVIARTVDGTVIAGELRRRTAKILEIGSHDPGKADVLLAMPKVSWLARIIWASQ